MVRAILFFIFQCMCNNKRSIETSKLINEDTVTHNIFDNSYKLGYDSRYKLLNENPQELETIKKHLMNNELLKTLENKKKSIFEKTDLIDKNNILNHSIAPCLFNGGLLDDWVFNMGI